MSLEFSYIHLFSCVFLTEPYTVSDLSGEWLRVCKQSRNASRYLALRDDPNNGYEGDPE